MLQKNFNQDLASYIFLSKKLIHVNQKVCLRFKLFKKIFKAVYKNNPRTHSLQQNKKALLTPAAYFEVSTQVSLQRQ